MAFIIGMMVATFLAVSVMALSLGIAAPVISTPSVPDPDPGILEGIFQMAIWTINALGALFQLMTFQVGGIPTIVSTLLFVPITFLIFYVVVRLVRGGG